MCFMGKVAKTLGKVAPLGAIGLGASLFGGKKKAKTTTVKEPFNARGSYTDPATGNVIVPAEVVAAQRSPTGMPMQSLFTKG